MNDAMSKAVAVKVWAERAGLEAMCRGNRVVTYDPKSDRLSSQRVVFSIPDAMIDGLKLKYERGAMPKTDGGEMQFVRITILED